MRTDVRKAVVAGRPVTARIRKWMDQSVIEVAAPVETPVAVKPVQTERVVPVMHMPEPMNGHR